MNGRVVSTKIGDFGQNSTPRYGQRLIDQLRNALALGSGDGYNRNSQSGTHLLHINGAAVGAHLVHHIQRQNHRDPKLQKLKGEVQIALDISGIDNIDNAVRLLVQNKIP